MRRNLIYFLSGLGCLSAFVLFSYLVHKNFFTQIDFDTTVRFQNNISTRFDDIFSLFSDVGSFEPMTIMLFAILIFWRKIIAGVALLGGFVSFHLIEIFGKYFVDHPPPPEFMLRTKHNIEFPQFHVRAEFSYPSGHSGRTIFISALLLFMIWNSKRIPVQLKVVLSGIVLVYDVVMLVSRIYLGEHWLTDVVGGGLLALALVLFGFSLYELPWLKKPQKVH